MYRTCLFCHSDLGANEVIEHFPVGRRLAFDAAKGRLWVVCQRCLRWNLTPLDERWEAIEECERTFRDTKLRVSTENIGMASLGEGLELVRIGRALRPEIAVWRYGAINTLRRRKGAARALLGVAFAGVSVGIFAQVPAWGVVSVLLSMNSFATIARRLERGLFGLDRHLVFQTGRDSVRVPLHEVGVAELIRRSRGDWLIRLQHEEGDWIAEGENARRQLGRLMSAVNFFGTSPHRVRDAERLLSEAGGTDEIIDRLASTEQPIVVARPAADISAGPSGRPRTTMVASATRELRLLPAVERIALEMAANEENERRAMEGELAMLEAAWKEAEEIAAIADDMFLPESVRAWLDRARGR